MEGEKIMNIREEKGERDYRELERLSRKLKIPVPMAKIKVVASLDGKVTGLFEGRSKTWTRNYWNTVFAPPCNIPGVVTNWGAGYLSIKQTSGTVAAMAQVAYWQQIPHGVINDSSYGIIPGRGEDAESFESYALSTPITHGSGANQLGFRASTESAVYTSETKTWAATLSRLFDNTSGDTIDITETGIVCYTSALGIKFLNCRDLLGAPVPVLNAGVLTITYTVSLTFPE